jgi:hypothetical protein
MNLLTLKRDLFLFCSRNIGVGGSPVPCACAVSHADDGIEKLTDDAAEWFVKRANKHRPKSREEIEEKLRKRIDRTSRRERTMGWQGQTCGFFPIFVIFGEALLSFLFQRIFAWLWGKYTSAQDAVCGLAAEVPDNVESDDAQDD